MDRIESCSSSPELLLIDLHCNDLAMRKGWIKRKGEIGWIESFSPEIYPDDPIILSKTLICHKNIRRATLTHERLAGTGRPLTPKEFGLLELFVKQPGRALTRDQVLNAVWDYDIIVTQRSVDRCINSLRNKLGNPAYIQTVRESGYRFDPGI